MKNTISQIAEMGVGGVRHLVERAYREGSELQYIRELFKNSLEAGATRIEFGPEWQAVQRQGVYRLMVADNGKGMEPEELLKFLNTFGGGGKPIGDAHENFGVGAKTSLLPWNSAGVIVLSWVAGDPEGSMVWLMRDPDSGEYGAKRFRTEEGAFEEVVRPHGDFVNVKPEWIDDHGTVVICLGNTGQEDTFLGKDGQGDIKGTSAYLNKRIWDLPSGVEVFVQELRSQKKADWPSDLSQASAGSAPASGKVDRRWNRRQIMGASYYLTKPGAKGKLSAAGSIDLEDGTVIEWYLWDGDRPAIHSYAHMNGYITARYNDELYDTQQHFSQFRSFGITQKDVRTNLTLVAVPPKSGRGAYGVYPDTARNALKIQDTKRAGEGLPWPEWAQQFAEDMPAEIAKAIAKAGPADSSGSIRDSRWKERLVDRFGRRWKTIRYLLNPGGQHKVHPIGGTTGAGSGGQNGGGGSGGSGGTGPVPGGDSDAQVGVKKSTPGPAAAPARNRKGGVPDWEWTDESNMEPGFAAAWCASAPGHENGLVQLNREFAPFVELKQHWRDQYADHLADQIDRSIEEVYGEVMVARIAHSEELRSDPRWGSAKVDSELRSPSALTMAALGLLSEDQLIAGRLAGRVGGRVRRKDAAVAA